MKIAPINLELIDSMGSDLSVVNAARVSFAKESDWNLEMGPITMEMIDGNMDIPFRNVLPDGDVKLINYLAKHNHFTPFCHSFLSFRIKAPIFVARQLVKHQVGLSWNEESRRYIDEEPEFYIPEVYRAKPEGSIKQGSGIDTVERVDVNVTPYDVVQSTTYQALGSYNSLLEAGVAPEQARMVLPLNTMTNWIWSGSLAAFARVCKLRLDPHSQKETRDVATLINAAVPACFEHSWKALVT